MEAGPYFLYGRDDFLDAIKVLKRGELVALPTETVYGLAGDATNEAACRTIFAVKGRPLIDPLIVHVGSLEKARQFAVFNEVAHRLALQFWPGALTLILPKLPTVSPIITAGLATVAIRMPVHSMAHAILNLGDIAVAAPSANPFGYLSPTCVEHVMSQLGRKISHFIDGGPCRIGVESTIIDLSNPQKPVMLRPGGIPRQDLELCLGCLIADPEPREPADENSAMPAPGMLTRHYSPGTPVTLFEHLSPAPATETGSEGSSIAIVYQSRKSAELDTGTLHHSRYWFAEEDDTAEAAHNLFALLHKLDAMSHRHLYIEKAPIRGLGQSINDRLIRAAAGTA
jgi:L-threonylcarbamoyladenylate synthase